MTRNWFLTMRATEPWYWSLTCGLLLAAFLQAADSPLERGMADFQSGRYTHAGQELQQALAADPHDQRARAFLALTRAATGHCAEAVPDLTTASASSDRDLGRLADLALVECRLADNETAKAVALVMQLESAYPDRCRCALPGGPRPHEGVQ